MNKNKNTLIYLVSHNHIEFVESSLESILTQIDEQTDLIIIDSGSSDGSYEYLKAFANSNNINFYSKDKILTEIIDWVYENFAEKYKYIMRVDADDSISKNAINILRNKIEEDKNCGSVCGSWSEIDQQSNTLNKMILDNGYATSAFHGACTLFRSEAVKNIKFISNNVRSQDGLYTWLKIKDEWKCRTISEIIFQYRRHNNNLSNEEERLFSGRCSAYQAICNEKKLQTNSCAVIGYNDDEIINSNEDAKKNIIRQIEYIQNCNSIENIYISSDSSIFDDLDLENYTKVSLLRRAKTADSLVKSLQSCLNLQKKIANHSDVLLLNPLKNIWNSNFIDIGVYSKSVHSYKTVIACNLIKGTVFNEENESLKLVNFSNLNTVFTSNFLFIKLPGFLLVGADDFYTIDDNYPKPVGHVSNNFLSLGINSF